VSEQYQGVNPLSRPDYVRVEIGGLLILADGMGEVISVSLNGQELPPVRAVALILDRGKLPVLTFEQAVYPQWGREQR
jgi:hypothetical protein